MRFKLVKQLFWEQKKIYRGAVYRGMLKPNIRRRYLAQPDLLLEVVHSQPDEKTIVIDEV